jgi:outer membrane receptor protein involved in Fe transport
MFTNAHATLLLLLTLSQDPALVRGTVVDISGAAVPDAIVVLVLDGREQPITVAADGTFHVRPGAGVLLVKAPGFADATHDLQATGTAPFRVILQPATFASTVVVTADRGAARLPSGASATVITSAELATSAAGALDDVLRQTPGFTLFRRSSSRTANPTTQGVTLRGVSGSGASRTLVLADGVPLNDPFGSWVYWNRVPMAAIDRVEVVRGGAGDLYGADALGGVIQLLTFSPARPRLRATIDGGSHGTARLSLFGGATLRRWSATAAGEWLRTDGVLTIGPESVGIVDTPADSDYRTGFVSFGTQRTNWRSAVRLSAYDEHRNNGTVVQLNSTAWRQLSFDLGGVVAGGAWEVHAAGGSQEYYQTFSAVAALRNTERLTTEQWTPSEFATGSAQWTRSLGNHTLLIGAEADRTESTVDEYRYALINNINTASGPFVVGGTARNSALYARLGVAATDAFTLSVGLRGDFWSTDPLLATDPSKSASFFSPRLGAAYRAGAVSVQAAVYRAYRTPTLNELYRGFRVGNIQTNPNPRLGPERLTGVEFGALWSHRVGSARVTTFVNTLEGAVANFTVGTQGTTILRERRNSDEIRASGVEIETDWRFTTRLTAHAQMTVTSSHYRGSEATPTLEGNRVPQVPRVQFGGALTWMAPQMLTLSAQLRGSGRQFDDDLNTRAFELPGYGVVDFFASRPLARALQVFVSLENAFDVEYETGRTPLRTIGWPRTTRVGARIAFP